SALHHELNRFYNLTLIGIALRNHCEGHTMSAENQLRTRRVREAAQRFIYFLYQGFQIKIVTIERLNAMDRNVVAKLPSPLIQTAAGSGLGILWVQRKQDDLVAFCYPQLLYRLSGKGMPVTHGHETTGIQTGFSAPKWQGASLLLSEPPDGRAPANRRVVVLDLPRSSA